MVSINTNLSSLLVQNNLAQSTNSLSKAVERLTTGYKINHASDNAAGYSIAQDMTSKLSSYDVAADNISMGLDLLSVAQTTISQMQSRGERLMALWTQAQNGTFGPTSLSAINQEATAIMQEINRLYMNTEYNGIKLFEGGIKLPDWADTVSKEAGLEEDISPKYNGFIKEAHHIDDAEVNAMTHVSDIDNFVSGETYAITSVDDLVKLASLVNAGKDSTNVTFIMGNDINIFDYCTNNTIPDDDEGDFGGWIPIGINYSNAFKGNFDGNGHKIEGLYIRRKNYDYQGLFGYVTSGSIKNIGVEGNVNGKMSTGGLIGMSDGNTTSISNCYSKVNVTSSSSSTGGLIGALWSGVLQNCYTTGNVTGKNQTGGLVGDAVEDVINCFSTGIVRGTDNVGGLVGQTEYKIINCYASGNVSGNKKVGGLVGATYCEACRNCYATGSVNGNEEVGGLAGELGCYIGYDAINCYATGNVVGNTKVGGFVGSQGSIYESATVSNCYAVGNVNGTSQVGGFAGFTYGNMNNCYATGSVIGVNNTGGFVGIISVDKSGNNVTIDNIYANTTVEGETSVGGFAGAINTELEGTSSAINITNVFIGKGNAAIGKVYQNLTTPVEYDMSGWLDNITVFDNAGSSAMTMQVGISGDNSSQIMFETTLDYDLSEVETNGINSVSAYDTISNFLSQLSDKATEFGAVSNRLESALESTTVAMENITSSLSTIKDADIAKESSEYIKKQILQQASATLLATANQSPSIALQLL